MSAFNKVSPLRFWCQKVLPLVYDESLSYEELLCKVVAKLNEVINNIDGIPDYIKELLSEENLHDLLSELLDELRLQICPENDGTRTTTSKDRKQGDLVWLNGKLICITRDILAGTEYIEQTDAVGITGNYIFTSITAETRPSYSSDNMRLTIHGYVDSTTSIVTRGDTHIYEGASQTIRIEEV